MAPEDTLQHFDAVVRGPVEGIWPTLFSDFKDGQLQSIYQGCHDASFAQPNRSVFINSTYLKAGIVQTARGMWCRVSFLCGAAVLWRFLCL